MVDDLIKFRREAIHTALWCLSILFILIAIDHSLGGEDWPRWQIGAFLGGIYLAIRESRKHRGS